MFKGKNTENQAKKQENIENGLLKKKNQQRNYANAKKSLFLTSFSCRKLKEDCLLLSGS